MARNTEPRPTILEGLAAAALFVALVTLWWVYTVLTAPIMQVTK
jgi:hypothetical protein